MAMNISLKSILQVVGIIALVVFTAVVIYTFFNQKDIVVNYPDSSTTLPPGLVAPSPTNSTTTTTTAHKATTRKTTSTTVQRTTTTGTTPSTSTTCCSSTPTTTKPLACTPDLTVPPTPGYSPPSFERPDRLCVSSKQ